MANLCLAALTKLRDFLLDNDGVNTALADIGARDIVYLPRLAEENTLIQNVAAKMADENEPVTYPAVYLYCDRMDNEQLEKFRKFSGRMWLIADIRVSAERFVDLGSYLARYVEAVTTVLASHLGKWTENVAYSGAHKVRFLKVENGGQNFVERAQIEIELQAHE